MLIALLIALASAAHGGNWLSKGFVIAGLYFSLVAVLFYQGWQFALAGATLATAIYMGLRRGRQARAELSMHHRPSWRKAWVIFKAYYFNPLAWFSAGIAYLCSDRTKLGVRLMVLGQDGYDNKGYHRRVVEFSHGITIGIPIAIALKGLENI